MSVTVRRLPVGDERVGDRGGGRIREGDRVVIGAGYLIRRNLEWVAAMRSIAAACTSGLVPRQMPSVAWTARTGTLIGSSAIERAVWSRSRASYAMASGRHLAAVGAKVVAR